MFSCFFRGFPLFKAVYWLFCFCLVRPRERAQIDHYDSTQSTRDSSSQRSILPPPRSQRDRGGDRDDDRSPRDRDSQNTRENHPRDNQRDNQRENQRDNQRDNRDNQREPRSPRETRNPREVHTHPTCSNLCFSNRAFLSLKKREPVEIVLKRRTRSTGWGWGLTGGRPSQGQGCVRLDPRLSCSIFLY